MEGLNFRMPVWWVLKALAHLIYKRLRLCLLNQKISENYQKNGWKCDRLTGVEDACQAILTVLVSIYPAVCVMGFSR